MGSRASRRRTGGIVGLVAVAHELSSGTAQRIIIFDWRFGIRSNLREEVRNFVACNARVSSHVSKLHGGASSRRTQRRERFTQAARELRIRAASRHPSSRRDAHRVRAVDAELDAGTIGARRLCTNCMQQRSELTCVVRVSCRTLVRSIARRGDDAPTCSCKHIRCIRYAGSVACTRSEHNARPARTRSWILLPH